MSAQASMPSRRIGKLERPGCTIHYEVTGSGPAIVFAHGLGGNHMSWWQQVAHFSSRYHVRDLRASRLRPLLGHPGRPGPGRLCRRPRSADRALGLADVRLVAQSMGGWCGGRVCAAPHGQGEGPRPRRDDGDPRSAAHARAGAVAARRLDARQRARPRRSRQARHPRGGRRAHGRRAAGPAPALPPHRRHERAPRQGGDPRAVDGRQDPRAGGAGGGRLSDPAHLRGRGHRHAAVCRRCHRRCRAGRRAWRTSPMPGIPPISSGPPFSTGTWRSFSAR